MAEITVEKNEWLLTKLCSEIRSRPIKEITPAEILHLLLRLEKTGRLETARRLRSRISAVFKLAIQTLRAESNPAAHLMGATQAPLVKSHAAITDPKKFGALLCSIDDHDGWPTLRHAMQFAALTSGRPLDEFRKLK